jgi:hypothetical protein
MTPTPSRRARTIVAASVLPVLALIAIVAFWPRAATGAPPDAATHGHPGTAATAQSLAEPGSGGGPTPGPIALEAPPDSPVGGEPGTSLAEAASSAPLQRDGAQALGAPREAVDPALVVAAPGDLGGCRTEYGEDGQCLTVVPPSLAEHAADMRAAGLDPAAMAHPWTCTEVRALFPDGIAVRAPGIDPLGLDADGDQLACDPDD